MKTILGTLLALMFLLAPASALAQAAPSAPSPEFAEALKRGNAAYNGEQYAAALTSYRTAIQLDPRQPAPYKNSARAYFYLNQYAAAQFYYDLYTIEFPEAEDRAQIEAERRLASSRAKGPYALPANQKAALEALERALGAGVAISKGGGGAWKAYETLLRSGYAHPNLIKLRQRLAAVLVREHDVQLRQGASEPVPSLSLDDWEVQRQRLEDAKQVADDPELRATIERRASLYRAAKALYMSRYEEAASLAALAAEQNADLVFPRWMQISALMHANKHQDALAVLDALRPRLERELPTLLPYERVTRALVYQKLGRTDDAAALYMELLSD